MDESFRDTWRRWLYGLLMPIAFVIFGGIAIVTLNFDSSAFRLGLGVLEGFYAVLAGFFLIALGVMLHVLKFWYDHADSEDNRHLTAKICAGVMGVSALIIAIHLMASR